MIMLAWFPRFKTLNLIRLTLPCEIAYFISFLGPSQTFDELYSLYINDSGDDRLVDDDENTACIQSMADFLQDIEDS